MYHDRDRGFLRITLTGTVTIDMLVTAFHEVVRHPAGQPGMTLLWDFRRASFGGLTADDVSNASGIDHRLARQLQELVANWTAELVSLEAPGIGP
jgi:hypothetical protein